MEYTVIMSIYYKVLPEYLKFSMESVISQTLFPKKIILVKDGPLTEAQEEVIQSFFKKFKDLFEIISFSENRGCGPAYNEALKHCKTEYAMIMDSDDYIVPTKNEIQVQYLTNHLECDMVGTNTYEFIDYIENKISCRVMPETDSDIKKMAHKRCPIVQPSAMFRVSKVLESGSYQPSQLTEDYDLYIRMIQNGCVFYNLQKVLSYTRVAKDFYARRGGFSYLKPILGFKYRWYKNGFFTFREFLITGGSSLIVAIMPNWMRSIVYKKLLRKRVKCCEESI